MGGIENSGLLFPDIEWKTETGEVFFSLKQKKEWGGYYLFEKNLEVLPEEERPEFEKAWLDIMRMAGLIGIRLYDSKEIWDGLTAKAKAILQTEAAEIAKEKANRLGEHVLIKDIQVSLHNFATGEIESLTVGISVPPDSEAKRYEKEFLKTRPPKGPK